MDSTVLAYDLCHQGKIIIPLFIDYGQHCCKKEYSTLKKVLPESMKKQIKVIKIGDVYTESHSRMIKAANLWKDSVVADDLFLPYRNLLFLTIASAFAQSIGVGTVYSAFINSNHAKEIDCSLEFFMKLRKLLQEYGSVEVVFPYRNYTKTDVARLGISLTVPIDSTYSCQVNPEIPCGVCPNCVDRLVAINNVMREYIKND